MKFTQQTVRDLLNGWQNLSNEVRDTIIGDTLFPHEYSKYNPPRFSANAIDNVDTDKLIEKLNDLGFAATKTKKLPRSSLSVTCCGDVSLPPMPEHKALGFIGYCAAILKENNND